MALQGAGNLAVASTVPALHRRWRASVLVGAATLLIVGAEGAYRAWPSIPLILILSPIVGAATQVAMVSVRAAFQRAADTAWVGRLLGVRASLANLVAMAGSMGAAVAVTAISSQVLLLLGLIPLAAATLLSRPVDSATTSGPPHDRALAPARSAALEARARS